MATPELPFKIHSKLPLLAPATGLHLDLVHGSVDYDPPLFDGPLDLDAC
jgi:hypothetical protein